MSKLLALLLYYLLFKLQLCQPIWLYWYKLKLKKMGEVRVINYVPMFRCNDQTLLLELQQLLLDTIKAKNLNFMNL